MLKENYRLNLFHKLSNFITFKGAFKAFLFWPKFSLASYMIVNRLKLNGVKPKTIIDVGANVGQFTISAYKLFNKVSILSIEANDEILNELKINTYGLEGVEVISTAVGDFDGKTNFFINLDSQVSSLLKIGSDRKSIFPKSVVLKNKNIPIVTIDSLLKQRIVQEPILLKLDVQGAEEKVLIGAEASLMKIKWILIEISFLNLYHGEPTLDNLNDKMSAKGFKFVGVMNYHMSPDCKKIIEMDALFVRQ